MIYFYLENTYKVSTIGRAFFWALSIVCVNFPNPGNQPTHCYHPQSKGKRRHRRVRQLFKVTKLVSSETWTWTQAVWLRPAHPLTAGLHCHTVGRGHRSGVGPPRGEMGMLPDRYKGMAGTFFQKILAHLHAFMFMDMCVCMCVLEVCALLVVNM